MLLLLCALAISKGISSTEVILNESESCANDDRIWEVYMSHFSEADIIVVNILKDKINEVQVFEDIFLKKLYKQAKSKSVLLKRLVLKEEIEIAPFRKSSFDAIKANIEDLPGYLQRLKKYSSDPERAHFVLVENDILLKVFIQEKFKEIFIHPRALYIIVIVADVFNKLDLTYFWSEFGILNVVIYANCEFYKFDPFYKIHSHFGAIKVYDFNDILGNPHCLMNFLQNLNGITLSVTFFTRVPNAVDILPKSLNENLIYKSVKYAGLDGSVLVNLEKILNFKSQIIDPGEYRFGVVEKNGTAMGSLGDVVYRRAAIAMNSRFVSNYNTDQIEFTTPTNNDLLCVVVPKSKMVPHWIMLFHCFTIKSWVAIVGTFTIFVLLWGFLNCHSERSFIMEMFALILSQPTKINTNNEHSQRIFLSTCLIFNIIIIGGLFNGNLITSFSTVSFYRDIDTLEEVDRSDLLISTTLNIFSDADSESMRMIQRKKISMYYEGTAMNRSAYLRDIFALERKTDADFYIRIYFTNKNGLPMLHIVNECPTSYFLSYIVYKGSPFLPRFDWVIRMFVESGFTKKWHKDTVEGFIMDKNFQKFDQRAEQFAIAVGDIQAALFLYLIGLVAAILSFFIEIFTKSC